MFGRIRVRLTVWYVAVLLLVLAVFGLLLYVSVQQTLFAPADDALHAQAQQLSVRLQEFPGGWCTGPVLEPPDQLTACYDAQGNLQGYSRVAALVPGFDGSSLAHVALQNGSAGDTIGAGRLGSVRRYALRVDDPAGNVLGVIQVGQPVQTDILQSVLRVFLIVGVITVALASIGGLFLASRALMPARVAYRRQQEFIADASHELRTPLTLLRADADILLRDRTRLNADQAELLEDIVRETTFMSALADKMLDLARLEAGDARLERDVVDLATLAQDTGRRVEALASERGLHVEINVNGAARTIGDQLLLEQAALILVDNAIKYNGPGGEVTLRAWRADGQAHLSVQDTGIGVTSEHLPRLGQRFYRVDKARSRASGGAGLGISIARHIARQHGGSLQIASEPGRGTTATITLPAA